MKQRYAYAECYRILDVDPACSWDELRRAYKLQIQKWHPDKFAENTKEKAAADDKIKHLTAAHQQLVAYYRRHGKLPEPETAPPPRKLPQPNQARPGVATPSADWSKQPTATDNKSGLLPIIGGILLIGALFWFNSPNNNPNTPGPAGEGELKSDAVNNTAGGNYQTYEQIPVTEEVPVTSHEDEFVTYGTSIGEVISIQGPPTRSEGDTWYYGESELYFENGKVIGWKHMPGSKLKTGIATE